MDIKGKIVDFERQFLDVEDEYHLAMWPACESWSYFIIYRGESYPAEIYSTCCYFSLTDLRPGNYADATQLLHGAVYELAILAETQRFLAFLVASPAYARTLEVPDGSRRILDEESKLDGLAQLSREVDDLMAQIAREQQTLLTNPHRLSIYESRHLLNQRYTA
ncbi:hypothetical protein ACTVKO_23845 [Serratia nevei]|uniref:hypothetical protein n=1 Tax=Serratia nevei TaxID=2703794 RepID=UPI003FA6FD82